MRRLALLGLAGLAACATGTEAPTGPAATLVRINTQRFLPLPTNGAVWSEAYGLGGNGWVAGEVDISDTEWHAARWRITRHDDQPPAAMLQDLGMLNGRATLAFGVNDRGEVVGGSVEASFGLGPGPDEAFVYRDGVLRVLPTLGGEGAFARRINNHGWIAGSSFTAEGESHATIWRPNHDGSYTPIRLGRLGGTFSWCNTITDDGQVVGLSETADGAVVAWLWNGHGPVKRLPSVSPGGQNFAVDINRHGLIVGNGTDPDGFYHAARWLRGRVHDFHHRFPDYDFSFATAVNQDNEIAVFADVEAFAPRAYVVRGHQTIDLGAVAEAPLSDVYDINDRGWVAGGAELDGTNTAGIWFLRDGWPGHSDLAGGGRRMARPVPEVNEARITQLRLRRQLLTGGRVVPGLATGLTQTGRLVYH
jgi:uncharacterized membrane protein